MRLFRDAVKLLISSKILLIFMFLLFGFVVWETGSLYGKGTVAATMPLRNALTLSIYLFIMMMFLSYEYARKLFHNGVSEALLVTMAGRNRKNYKMIFWVMSIYSSVMSLFVGVIVVKEYLFYKISDPNHEYVVHIIKNIFLNDFLIMELGIIVGIALAVIQKRMGAYTIMCFLSILISPFATSMAYLIDLCDVEHSGVGEMGFKILSYFYIMPGFLTNLMPREEFGESILPYRFFIIGFWLFLCLSFICFTRNRYKKYAVVSVVLCLGSFIAYTYPASKMEQTYDIYLNGMPDGIYVWESKDYITKEEPADYQISEYDLNLSIRANLSATADMKVSKSLERYRMTLYRQYKVSKVVDQDGHKLEYTQNQDYIEVRNPNGYHITNIIISYKGSSWDSYANYQGCYLPGYYAYYPRAGYINLYDELGCIQPYFVDKDTYFKVKVNPGKYISNLPEKDGIYQGKCDGVTLVSGFYKIKRFENGNQLVYPYLDEFIIHDGKMTEKECWQETFDFVEEELAKDKIANCLIFPDEILMGNVQKAYGEKQIFVYSGGVYYYSDN
ncbi:MAG: hypothetical protein K2J67_10230 [Lachnospiraceae bacterium]|nr:hypothetical protein [Lachnospiraceae bacterium]